MAGRDKLERIFERCCHGSSEPLGPLLRDSLAVIGMDNEAAAKWLGVRACDLARWRGGESSPSDRRVQRGIRHKLYKRLEYLLGRARPTGTLPRLRLALQELRHRYHCGLGGGDCEGDYDFGYESGLDSACKSIVEDLDRLIAEFFPKAGKGCARPAGRSGKATANG